MKILRRFRVGEDVPFSRTIQKMRDALPLRRTSSCSFHPQPWYTMIACVKSDTYEGRCTHTTNIAERWNAAKFNTCARIFYMKRNRWIWFHQVECSMALYRDKRRFSTGRSSRDFSYVSLLLGGDTFFRYEECNQFPAHTSATILITDSEPFIVPGDVHGEQEDLQEDKKDHREGQTYGTAGERDRSIGEREQQIKTRQCWVWEWPRCF